MGDGTLSRSGLMGSQQQVPSNAGQMQKSQLAALQAQQHSVNATLAQRQQLALGSQGAYTQAAIYATNQAWQAMQQKFDPWEYSKYSKEEMTMAIGQQVRIGKIRDTIVNVNDHLVFLKNEGGVLPSLINNIPFIDRLRATNPLFRLVGKR